MGEYFKIVCHTCKTRMDIDPACKLREIRMNSSAAIMVGLFATYHPGHLIELRGDEYNYFGERDLSYAYRREVITPDEDTRMVLAMRDEKLLKESR